MKAFLIFLILLFCAFINLFLPHFIDLPSWYSFVAHFLIAGALLSCFVAEFWIWFEKESFFGSRPFLRFLGILAGDAFGGVFWEIFEYWYSQGAVALTENDTWFYSDTIWDFQMNFLGAIVIAWIYSRKYV